jgi:nicotinamide riboside kinase
VKKLALVGTACCGKTAVVELLQGRFISGTVLFVPEAARIVANERPELFYDENLIIERQLAIAEKQLEQDAKAELKAKLRGNTIIFDRCILDTYLYCVEVLKTVPDLVKIGFQKLMPSYDKFCLFDPADVDLEQDPVRTTSVNSELRTRWHKAFVRELSNYPSKTVMVSGSLRQKADQVTELIIKMLQKNRRKEF